jgi:hypothetical protein
MAPCAGSPVDEGIPGPAKEELARLVVLPISLNATARHVGAAPMSDSPYRGWQSRVQTNVKQIADVHRKSAYKLRDSLEPLPAGFVDLRRARNSDEIKGCGPLLGSTDALPHNRWNRFCRARG